MPEISPSKYLVTAGWDDVPHLSERTKVDLLRETPPHLRLARSKGIPSLGAGAIYPIPEEDITVADFALPRHFARGYAIDPGWNRTAALWGALDPESHILYLYSEHYRGQAEPGIHAAAVRARGAWMTGCMDPAARGRQQKDGEQLWADYVKDVESGGGGLKLVMAQKAVHAGLQRVWELLSTGRIKVFKSLVAFFAEYRIYRRDEKGEVVKVNDHLMDCMRYLVMTPGVLQRMPAPQSDLDAKLATLAGAAFDPYAGY